MDEKDFKFDNEVYNGLINFFKQKKISPKYGIFYMHLLTIKNFKGTKEEYVKYVSDSFDDYKRIIE